MTRGWAKSLLFESTIVAIVLLALLCSVQSVSAVNIVIDPSTINEVIFSFDQPKETAHYETTRSFTIKNTNPDSNYTDSVNIGSIDREGITITPASSSFSLRGGGATSVTLTIVASPSAAEMAKREFGIKVGEKSITVPVTIIHHAMLEVLPSSIDFGRVCRTDKPSETVTISEKWGYKDVEIVLKKETGNDWLKKDKTQIQIKKGSSAEIHFTLTPGRPDHNRYSWSFSLSPTTSNTQISPNMIHVEVYMLMPAKLGELDDEELEIKFDEPRGTKPEYERSIYVRVTNEGDEPMNFSSKIIEPREMDMKIISVYSKLVEVDGKDHEDIKIQITAPYYASEGTHHGRLQIEAGAAGRETVDIAIKILWPAGFNISSDSDYFWPAESAIDFGPLELKEQGYEKREMNLTITETYLYKPVQNLRFYCSGEYSDWLKGEWNFSEIPPGESRNITVKIEPGLEALPKDYLWNCNLSADDIKAKSIEVKAQIVPMNISMIIEWFRLFKESPLYTSYPSSEARLSNIAAILWEHFKRGG